MVGFGYPSLTHRRLTIIDVPSIIKQIPFGSFQGRYKTPTPFLNPLSVPPLRFDNDLLRLTMQCLTLSLSKKEIPCMSHTFINLASIPALCTNKWQPIDSSFTQDNLHPLQYKAHSSGFLSSLSIASWFQS